MNDKQNTEPTRILIIDDEAPFTRMVKLNMQNAVHYVVETLNDSPQARIVAKQFKPDVILLDVVMETDDAGLRVAKDIRETAKNNHIRIILLIEYDSCWAACRNG